MKKTILISLAVAAIFLSGCTSSDKDNFDNSTEKSSQNQQKTTTTTPIPDEPVIKSNSEQPEEKLIDEARQNTLNAQEVESSVNPNWNLYNSKKLGISISYPKEITEDVPQGRIGTINIEENSNNIILNSEVAHSPYEFSVYDLNGKTLESFVSEMYGKDCFIKNIDKKTFSVRNSAKNLEEFNRYECTQIVGKYSSEYNRVVTYKAPQWCVFWDSENKCVDGKILDSITFIKK